LLGIGHKGGAARQAITTVKQITILREKDVLKISEFNKTSSEKALTILQKLFSSPVVTVKLIQKWTKTKTRTGAQNIINKLITANILEIKDENIKYGRTYIYKKYTDIFENTF